MELPASDLTILEKLDDLRDSGGVEIDKDAVLDNYIDVEYKDRLDAISDPEEKEAYRKKLKKEYVSGSCKSWFDNQIEGLKDKVAQCKESLVNVKDAIVQTTASNAIPAVLTVGSASSSSNPAYTVIENKQKKKTLLTIIKQVNTAIQGILTAALLLHWVLPDAVTQIISTYVLVSSLVNAIPG